MRTAREVMDTETHAISSEAPVVEAVRLLVRTGVTGAPVVDETGSLVGMITEKECLQLLTGLHGGDVPTGTVAEYMSQPRQVGPETDVHYMAGLFRTGNFRRVAVVGAGKILGVVTRKDILRALDAELDDPRYVGTPPPAPPRSGD